MRHLLPITGMLVLTLTFGTLAAAAPGTIPIRGQLLDGDGVPLTGGREYAVQFYDAETDGTALGGELTGTATLSAEGLFGLSVAPPAEILSSSGVWYAIAVDSDATPNGIDANDWFPERVKVESVPFALQAGDVVHVNATAIADGSVSDAEFEALDGVSGALQTQLDAKLEAADIDATTAATNTNTAGVAANAADIAANTAGIAANATDIATNAAAIATKADAASVDASQAIQDAAIAMNAGDIATNAANIATKANSSTVIASQAAQDAVIATKADATDVLPRVGEAHVLVTVTDNATTNGTNLLAAYAEAKALTPHGAALSATNRAVVIVPPGSYDLGTGQLTLDAEFVDLVGLTTNRDSQYIFGTSNGVGTGVLGQTADDVRIENLAVECTRASGGVLFDATDPAAYFPDTTKLATLVRNCSFRADNSNALAMRAAIEYAGTFTDCTGSAYGFGYYGTASGTFTNCNGGGRAFGESGTASGTFTNCVCISGGFGGHNGAASGTFTDCTGGTNSFGGGTGGTASGTFLNCTGGAKSFGYTNGTVSGTFTNCSGGDYSFGGYGTANGTFTGCAGGEYAFGFNGTASGTFTNCIGGRFSFGSAGTASGFFTNCTGADYAFAGSGGTASGTFTGCIAEFSGFGNGGDATGGKFYHCTGGSSSFTTTGSPTVHYCVRNGVAYP